MLLLLGLLLMSSAGLPLAAGEQDRAGGERAPAPRAVRLPSGAVLPDPTAALGPDAEGTLLLRTLGFDLPPAQPRSGEAAPSYDDPTAGGQVPLMRVAGREDVRLSPHLRVGDFAASDGAAYARVAPALVDRLERLMAAAPGRTRLNSGYRHPTLNFAPRVGGALYSQHMAGRAADLWNDTLQPLELARRALETMGCDIGIGLGQHYIHVDVRGRLASWASAGAALDENAFDRWVLRQCAGALHADSTARADTIWMADSTTPGGPGATAGAVAAYEHQMATLAQAKHRQGLRGAVVLDLRTAAGAARTQPWLSFVEAGALKRLIPAAAPLPLPPDGSHYFYVVIKPDGSLTRGLGGLPPPRAAPHAPAVARQFAPSVPFSSAPAGEHADENARGLDKD